MNNIIRLYGFHDNNFTHDENLKNNRVIVDYDAMTVLKQQPVVARSCDDWW